MAPENNVVTAVRRTAVAADFDIALARKAASCLTPNLPDSGRQALFQEFLDRLLSEKASRDARGLNHWDHHAPRFLERVMAAKRGVHRRRVGNFIAANHEWLLGLAFRVTQNHERAERAAGKTYVELLEGKTLFQFAARSVVMNARDEMRLWKLDQQRLKSLEQMRIRGESKAFDSAEDRGESEPADFPSTRSDDRDPLDRMIEQEEVEAARAIAENDRKFWWIRQKNWGQALRIGAPKHR